MKQRYLKPELLAPAGNLEKLKTAILFGADAVYLGGKVFGLRKYAQNFELAELEEGINFAHQRNAKVYMVLNGFAHNQDLSDIKLYLNEIKHLSLDAFIISDVGVMQLARDITSIPIHVSTQASATSAHSCEYYKSMGATRVVLAREVSIEECKTITEHSDIELEVFIHGAMCASYSGKCVISNYTVGRDSNRGGCIQSCRHTYDIIQNGKTIESSHIMNAKDLMAIEQLPHIIKTGIHSLKVEGRMKSPMYLANTIRTYRKAIDLAYDCVLNTKSFDANIFEQELQKVSNRKLESGGLDQRPAKESINYPFGGYEKSVEFVGVVRQQSENTLYVNVRSTFTPNDTLELISQDGEVKQIESPKVLTLLDESMDQTKPNSLIKLITKTPAQRLDIIRKVLP